MTTMTGKTMSEEEMFEDLQRRFQLLEGERKATYETAQSNIRQNKEIIKQMKDENKTLRQQISQLRFEQPPTTEKQIEEKMAEVLNMKTKLDALVNDVKKKNSLTKDLQAKHKELQVNAKLPNSENSAEMRQIRVLENRLDKAMIKYNEAMSIRKTYEQIVKRLKEERVGFDNQLQAIERTLKAKEHDYEELLLLSHDAYHAKEMAQAELHRFEQGVMEERNQRDKEVQEKKALVQQRVEMNQRLEQRERMLKAQQDLDKSGEKALKSTAAMADIGGALTHKEAEDEKKRMQDYEDAFRRIKEATGVSDVNEVIQKFLTQEDTQANLMKLCDDNQKKIEELNEEKNRLKGKVEELKFSASGNVGRRQIVDDFETHLQEATNKMERNRAKYERMAKILIDVKGGVVHLADKLSSVKLDGEAPIEMSDETVEEVLSQCELKLSKLMQATNLDSRTTTKQLKIDSSAYEEKMMTKSQSDIRVKLNDADHDGDEEDDDDYEDEMDEDVSNRKHVKYNSEQIMEKQLRKMRKRQKGKKPA
mmetsp:Transcript_12862/g.30864  ORF Transcript_12862/g.30864 Transcript_12862/m.30864 type:complete len:535 (+) Transcript_12862:79-1683(+)